MQPAEADRTGPVPLFLISLPRSGSTLLQRMLATHPQIATGPEPTFLLPLLHVGRSSDVAATFDQRFTAQAVEDFLASTGAPTETFDSMVRSAAASMYGAATDTGARYFLDKTPKYHMICADLVRIFPDAPFVVLWRNPLSMIASLMSTWGGGGGRWNLHHFRLDLFHALPHLVDTVRSAPERFHRVRYEDLVESPTTETAAIFDALSLDPSEGRIDSFGEVELVGRVQDPNVATADFASVRTDRVDRWTSILSNPIRKAWCRRYLDWLGRDSLDEMGYDLDELHAQLDAIPTSARFLATDAALVPYDTLYRTFELELLGSKARRLVRGQRPLLAHK